MSYSVLVEKISRLPETYYDEVDEYVETLMQKAQAERERELENAIAQAKADIAAGRFHNNVEDHLKRVKRA